MESNGIRWKQRAHTFCVQNALSWFSTLLRGGKNKKMKSDILCNRLFWELFWFEIGRHHGHPFPALILYVITDSGLDMNNWGETAVNTEALNDATIDEVHAAQL